MSTSTTSELTSHTEAKPIALSIPGAVRCSGLSRATLYRHIANGRLPIRKAGSRTLVLMSDLAAFIESLPGAGAVK